MNKGMVVVISAPSGCGKDTVVKALCKVRNDCHISVSATTRNRRSAEIDGKDYFFKTIDEFEEMIRQNDFLEFANYNGNYYGTPKSEVLKSVENGKICILVIETIGAAKIMKMLPDCLSIFLMPPSLEVLEKRLVDRGTDSEDCIKSRLLIANDELKKANDYDYCVVNDILSVCVNEIDKIITNELNKRN